MKNFLRLSAAAAALTVVFSASLSEVSAQATATATASATIVTPIAISKTADMNFGNVAVHAINPGTVAMSAAAVRSITGGVTLPATTGTVSAASFTVSGQGNYTYAITLPSTTVTIANGAITMDVHSFTSSPSSTGTLSAGGTDILTVGATLDVAGGQAAGTYTSATPFSVTVNYN